MDTNSEQLTSNFNSKFLFYGLLVYSVLYHIQPGGRIPALAPFRLEFVVGSILFAAIIHKIVSGKIPIKENKLNSAAIIFFLFLALTLPFASVKTRALDQYISYVKFFSVYLMIISCMDNEKRLKIFMSLYLLMISIVFVEPFLLSLKGEGFRYNNHMMRLYGVTSFFGHPNQLGGITSANLPLFYFMIPYYKSRIVKASLFGLMVIAIRVIMLTQSRTAFVGVVVFLGVLWILSKKKLKITVIMLLVIAVIWSFMPLETKDRFLTLRDSATVMTGSEADFATDDELGSMSSRWILFKRSMIIFIENPIIGVGMNCYPSVAGNRWHSWFPTHNLYTQALSEIGLVGTIAFLYIIYLIFQNLNRVNRIIEATEDKSIVFYVNKALYVFLIIRLTIGLFGHDLYRSWWWFIAALSIVNLRILINKYPEQCTENLNHKSKNL